jgi:hypothetical protein
MATIFNINPMHVKYVRSLLKNKDIVIIHGDGHIFASNANETTTYIDDEIGEVVTKSNAVYGSNHHKTFNSGYKESEATARGGYRAIYKKGDQVPDTIEDIEKAFYDQANRDLLETTTSKVAPQSNIFKLEDEEPVTEDDSKAKRGRPAKTENKTE